MRNIVIMCFFIELVTKQKLNVLVVEKLPEIGRETQLREKSDICPIYRQVQATQIQILKTRPAT